MTVNAVLVKVRVYVNGEQHILKRRLFIKSKTGNAGGNAHRRVLVLLVAKCAVDYPAKNLCFLIIVIRQLLLEVGFATNATLA